MSAVADALTEAIGAEVSRNAVAGRTRRLRELGHDIEARQVPERLVQAKEQPIHLPQRPEPAIMRPDVIVTHDDGVEYSRLNPRGCKALLDKRGADGFFMCCGKRQKDGSVYCKDHYNRYYTSHRER